MHLGQFFILHSSFFILDQLLEYLTYVTYLTGSTHDLQDRLSIFYRRPLVFNWQQIT